MWLTLVKGALQVVGGLLDYLNRKQLMDAGAAKAAKEATDEAMELVEYAQRVDRDTGSLSAGARKRMRDAIRRHTE
jgi:ABC-type Mn2+/Zn2+ transport system ATPase subunit